MDQNRDGGIQDSWNSHLWSRSDAVLPYCEVVPNSERQPNPMLRRARGHRSQDQLAELVNQEIQRATGSPGALTAKTISDWERGWYSWPAGPSRDALCAVLGVADPTELGFRRHWPKRTTANAAALTSEPSLVPAFAIDDSKGTLGAVDLDGIRQAIETRKRMGRIDPARVVDLATVAAAHRRSYRDIPARLLIHAAQAHLNLTWSLRPDYQSDGTRKALLTVVGEMAALVGTVLLLDKAQPNQAWKYIDLAWSAGTAAENPELQAVVLGGKSLGTAYVTGDHRAGLELAEYACEVAAAGASVETRGWVAAVASERCASLDDIAGCQRYLDLSREALDSAPNEVPVLGIGEFTIDKLGAYEGGDLVRMGRYNEAASALDVAIERLGPSMQRHRCTALTDRAEARLGANEIEGACQDAEAALDLVKHVQHVGNFERIHAVAQRAHASGAVTGRALWHNVLASTTHPKCHSS